MTDEADPKGSAGATTRTAWTRFATSMGRRVGRAAADALVDKAMNSATAVVKSALDAAAGHDAGRKASEARAKGPASAGRIAHVLATTGSAAVQRVHSMPVPGAYMALYAALEPDAARFRAAVKDPATAQKQALRRVLEAARGTRQLRGIRALDGPVTAKAFQDALPMATYDGMAHDIDAVAAGKRGVLTRAPVRFFERSGGSSGAQKLIPVTDAFLADVRAGLAAWLSALFQAEPGVQRGRAYWSISPLPQTAAAAETSGGIPIGAADDTVFFPTAVRLFIARTLAVGPAVTGAPDLDAARYITLRQLLAADDLAMISVWSPTFLTALLEVANQHAAALIADIRHGTCTVPHKPGLSPAAARARQAHIDAVLAELTLDADPFRAGCLDDIWMDEGRFEAAAVWPRLVHVSAWADADAARFVPALEDVLGGLPVTGKGLLATEGIVTVPIPGAPGPVLCVTSHFYEFIDTARPDARPLLAHELLVGHTYDVVLSTTAGLLRYKLGDRVECVGQYHAAPCLRFIGRSGLVSDLVGEKLSGAFVSRVLSDMQAVHGITARVCLVPHADELGTTPGTPDAPGYVLLVDAAVPDAVAGALAKDVEAALCAGHPYAYARDLGQLGAVSPRRVADLDAALTAQAIARGQIAGDIKPLALLTGRAAAEACML